MLPTSRTLSTLYPRSPYQCLNIVWFSRSLSRQWSFDMVRCYLRSRLPALLESTTCLLLQDQCVTTVSPWEVEALSANDKADLLPPQVGVDSLLVL